AVGGAGEGRIVLDHILKTLQGHLITPFLHIEQPEFILLFHREIALFGLPCAARGHAERTPANAPRSENTPVRTMPSSAQANNRLRREGALEAAGGRGGAGGRGPASGRGTGVGCVSSMPAANGRVSAWERTGCVSEG